MNPSSVALLSILLPLIVVSLSMGLAERKVWLGTCSDEAHEEMRINFMYATIAIVFAVLLFASEYGDIVEWVSKIQKLRGG